MEAAAAACRQSQQAALSAEGHMGKGRGTMCTNRIIEAVCDWSLMPLNYHRCRNLIDVGNVFDAEFYSHLCESVGIRRCMTSRVIVVLFCSLRQHQVPRSFQPPDPSHHLTLTPHRNGPGAFVAWVRAWVVGCGDFFVTVRRRSARPTTSHSIRRRRPVSLPAVGLAFGKPEVPLLCSAVAA